MSNTQKFNWAETLNGLKSLTSRNAILAILLNITNQYTNNMRIGFRAMIGSSIGLTGTVIGLAFSLYSIAGLFMRTPAGSIGDQKRDKIKYILAFAFVLKAIIFALFAFVKSSSAFYIVYILDGAVYAFITTLIPVILACSVDKKAMGSAYALYMGLMQIAIASARSNAASIFNSNGQAAVSFITAGLSLTSVICALCLDSKQLSLGSKPKQASEKKKGILSGLNMAMLPLAVCCGLCIFPFTVDGNFTVLFAESEGYDYLNALTLGQTIFGFTSILSGFLCDLMNPVILIVISLVGMILGFGMMGIATTSMTFCAGIIVYQVCRYWNTPFKIVGMKAVSSSEQGSFQATMLLVTDLVAVFASTIAGVAADQMGYSGVFLLTSGVLAINLILFLFLKKSGKI